MQELQTEWNLCKRYDYPLTLLHCEIDNLQDILVTLNAKQSSQIMLAVANAIRDFGHRPGDSVAHINPVTFAVILSDSQMSHAVNCAQELVARISALQIKVLSEALPIQVTMSIGVASLYPEGNTTMMTLHDNAKTALTEAKLTGGNNWCMYRVSHILTT